MKTCPACQGTYPTNFAVCPQDGTPLVEVGAWTPGAVIRGKYRILDKIGQGGMGAVYKALHVTFDELRAIKVISPELINDQLFVRRFKHEAVITRKLQHPNAVRVDDIDEAEDGRPFIVMEFIEGESLRKLIQEQGAMPVPRVCSIIKQTAAALDAAHRLGMVHRDIKPDNIVLIQTPEGEQAKVLDFGIAKIKEGRRGAVAGMTLTGTGIVIGTPQYMSPEQAMGKRGEELDGRSDLYSLGIVMYQMLTGDLPFKADTTMEMLLAHLQQPAPNVRAVRPELGIPNSIANVVVRLLEKKPENRPSNAQALIEEIERAEANGEGPGETRVVSAEAFYEQPINAPPPPIPTRRQASRPSRAVTTASTSSPEPRRALEPATPMPSRRAPAPRPAPTPAPVLVARPRKTGQWGIWVALSILVVGLGAGAWYFTERRPAEQPPPQNSLTRPQSAPTQSQAPTAGSSVAPTQPAETQPATQTEPSASPASGLESAPARQTTSPAKPGASKGSAKKTVPAFVQLPSRSIQGEPAATRVPETRSAPPVDTKKIKAAISMGEFYFDHGDYDKAIDEFQQGLAIDPANMDLKSRISKAKRAKAAEEQLNR
jgi:serine/threonine-protein kinase